MGGVIPFMQADEMRALRLSMGWSQPRMAEALGLTREWIGLMERGIEPINRRTELAIRYLADKRAA